MNKDTLKNCICKAIDELMCEELCSKEWSGIIDEIGIILKDEANDDFMCVEKITELYEKYGFSCGTRHDF